MKNLATIICEIIDEYSKSDTRQAILEKDHYYGESLTNWLRKIHAKFPNIVILVDDNNRYIVSTSKLTNSELIHLKTDLKFWDLIK